MGDLMSWIQEIDETEADSRLAEAYARVTGERGKLSNIMKAQSLNPEAMMAHLDLYLAVMYQKGGHVSRELRELIGTAISAENNCKYCVEHHSAALNHYWKDDVKIDDFIENYEYFDLPENDQKALDYALKLTRNPQEITEVDIEILRNAGFSDKDILRINLIAAYFGFVNRVILGLGIEFSQEEVGGYHY